MAPALVDQSINVQVPAVKSQLKKKPLTATGALDQFKHIDLTPVIGREYPTLNVVELMESPNADELIKELAYTSNVSAVHWAILSSNRSLQSLHVVLFSCASKTASTTNFKSASFHALANSRANPPPQACISIRS